MYPAQLTWPFTKIFPCKDGKWGASVTLFPLSREFPWGLFTTPCIPIQKIKGECPLVTLLIGDSFRRGPSRLQIGGRDLYLLESINRIIYPIIYGSLTFLKEKETGEGGRSSSGWGFALPRGVHLPFISLFPERHTTQLSDLSARW
jgi:hypothetical protein